MTPWLIIVFALCRAVDGDSLVCDGQRVRLRHLDAPEMHGPNRELAQAAKDRMALLVADGRVVCSVTEPARDRYGRLLGDCRNSQGVDLSRAMLDAGLAVPYEGGRRVPY